MPDVVRMRREPGPRTALVAGALALAAGGLCTVELRRQGLTEKLELVPDEVAPEAPAPPPTAPAPASPALARSLFVFLLDGLRVDNAEALPAWKELAPRGARLRARVRFPVYSAPGRSLLVTGAPPEVTGLVGNGRKAGGKTDHLLARAAAAGFAVTGSRWEDWLGLAPLERREPSGATRVLAVEDWFDCDHEGHAHGAASEEYRSAALALSDRLLGRVAGVDLARDAVLALADHGHTDRGGHLGLDPEVATAPVLLVGAGVRAGFGRDEPVAMEDVGATAEVLLGLEAPALARGVPVVEALTLAPEAAAATVARHRERRDALARAWDESVQPARVLGLRAAAALLVLAVLAKLLRPRLDRAHLVAALAPALGAGIFAVLLPPMSANGGPRWLVPEYLSLFVGACVPVIALARVLGLERAAVARALLLAWAIPGLALLVRYGLGPSGIAPSPGSFVLVLDLAFLAFTASVVAALGAMGQLEGADPREGAQRGEDAGSVVPGAPAPSGGSTTGRST